LEIPGHNVTMDLPNVDPRDQASIMAVLEEVTGHFWQAFDTHESRAFFDAQESERGRKHGSFLFPHLVRFYANLYLADQGLQSRIDPIWKANDGVALRYKWIDVRFLKAYAGSLPPPGRSSKKRAFYRQAIQDPIWLFDEGRRRDGAAVNLVVTWEIDADGNLTELTVYCPREGGRSPESVKWYWKQPLRHPALMIKPVEVEPEAARGPDLPIFPEEPIPGEREEAG
jgi:hypothetical protein